MSTLRLCGVGPGQTVQSWPLKLWEHGCELGISRESFRGRGVAVTTAVLSPDTEALTRVGANWDPLTLSLPTKVCIIKTDFSSSHVQLDNKKD